MASVDISEAACLLGIPHGFLGRRGGVSAGALTGLNVGLGSGDDTASVMENRRRAVDAIAPGAALVTPYQVHSATAVVVDTRWTLADRPRADGLVTNRPGVLLGVVTADCAPVLLADRSAGVVGAAHAGWRGAHSGVIEATLAAMEQLGAKMERISAAVGPCIAQASYEIDADFRKQFNQDESRFFENGKLGHFQFDLPGYVASRLKLAGLSLVEGLDLDTYALDDRFYSFRRATHRGEADYGRQFSLIGLPE